MNSYIAYNGYTEYFHTNAYVKRNTVNQRKSHLQLQLWIGIKLAEKRMFDEWKVLKPKLTLFMRIHIQNEWKCWVEILNDIYNSNRLFAQKKITPKKKKYCVTFQWLSVTLIKTEFKRKVNYKKWIFHNKLFDNIYNTIIVMEN